MKKLIALLLLLIITQANIADELYDLVKDDLTHIVCNASGEQSRVLGSANDKVKREMTDYFSFTTVGDFGYLWMKLQDAGYVNTLVFFPSFEEGKKQGTQGTVNESYEVISFNDETIAFRFEANADQRRNLYEDGQEFRKLYLEWSIDRISGKYQVKGVKHVYISEVTNTLISRENIKGSCEAYDPNVKKF